MRSSKTHCFSSRCPYRLIVILITAFLVLASTGVAQDDQTRAPPLPLIAVGRTAPKILKSTAPTYPESAERNWSEGWVMLSFTVSKDGTPKDIVAVDGMGTQEFFDSAIQGARRWQFKPGTENGQPVDTPDQKAAVLYRFRESQLSHKGSPHPSFVRKYRQAQSLIEDRRFSEAATILEDTLQSDRLGLYDEVMASLALAQIYVRSEPSTALDHIRHATYSEGEYLDRRAKATAFRLLVLLEAMNGNLCDALDAFEVLKKIEKNLDPSDDVVKTVEQIKSALASPASYSVKARLHASLENPTRALWIHRLSRPAFAFSDINGRLERFRLACSSQAVEAAIDDKLQWRVARGGGNCTLFVYGAPGTTFELIESA